ncbi:hypothetical protein EVAR_30376_1 [Eumeta japonica]|uniref:Uncharacterized protein n=1 Tax=Eumeta variegata TaxID=151549 RepID=A0A4C1W7Z4_EUMVA|nr:hypothetical protein EVAR_30376_1 [Eumeta japonica]
MRRPKTSPPCMEKTVDGVSGRALGLLTSYSRNKVQRVDIYANRPPGYALFERGFTSSTKGVRGLLNEVPVRLCLGNPAWCSAAEGGRILKYTSL